MKKDDDWKKIYSNWKMSKKRKELMQRKKMLITINMKKEDIENVLENSFEYHQLSKEDKEELDILNDLLRISDKQDVINNLAGTLLQLYFMQKRMEKQEEYEICAGIQTLVQLEIEEADRLVKTYHEDFLSDEFKAEAINGAKQQINLNYDIWNEMNQSNQ